MPTNDASQGLSNCYVFKSRLQEYGQKMGLSTPVYETIKEGPSHEPSFRSTVIVNGVRYDSLPGFFNRKAAEQSAAEVALMELTKSGEVNECISQPVHETGLCKNLLQEYLQKMNLAIPLYTCNKDEARGRATLFQCTIEVGGTRYVGAAAKTKKEAEIKAARTALLALQSSASQSSEQVGHSQLTVLPCKKRGAESVVKAEESANAKKSKKPRYKKKVFRRKCFGNKGGQSHNQIVGEVERTMDSEAEKNTKSSNKFINQRAEFGILAEKGMGTLQMGTSNHAITEKGTSTVEIVPESVGISELGERVVLNSREIVVPMSTNVEVTEKHDTGEVIFAANNSPNRELNDKHGVGDVTSKANSLAFREANEKNGAGEVISVADSSVRMEENAKNDNGEVISFARNSFHVEMNEKHDI